jgi:hypothetical protein
LLFGFAVLLEQFAEQQFVEQQRYRFVHSRRRLLVWRLCDQSNSSKKLSHELQDTQQLQKSNFSATYKQERTQLAR